MAIEQQPLSMVLPEEQEIELEIMEQPVEETEVFIQPDGSAILGSDMPDQATAKFGENLAEMIDERELYTIAT